jgi:hypothetical protein
MLEFIAEIVKYLLIFTGVMFALLIVLLVVISTMPESNPLKRMLTALSYRVAATFGATAIAIPLEVAPPVELAYDVAAPVLLAVYWFTFFRNIYREHFSGKPPAKEIKVR